MVGTTRIQPRNSLSIAEKPRAGFLERGIGPNGSPERSRGLRRTGGELRTLTRAAWVAEPATVRGRWLPLLDCPARSGSLLRRARDDGRTRRGQDDAGNSYPEAAPSPAQAALRGGGGVGHGFRRRCYRGAATEEGRGEAGAEGVAVARAARLGSDVGRRPDRPTCALRRAHVAEARTRWAPLTLPRTTQPPTRLHRTSYRRSGYIYCGARPEGRAAGSRHVVGESRGGRRSPHNRTSERNIGGSCRFSG